MSKLILWASALCLAVSPLVFAERWSKRFTVGASPDLRVETNDANVTIRTGTSGVIEARVVTGGWRIGPGDVRVSEQQSGDRVQLEVKVPNLHFNLGNRWVKIELQVPAKTAADIHTGDGNIRAEGLRGKTKLVTHDGNIDGEDFDGSLQAESGDGNIRLGGRFDVLQIRTGDGNIDAAVRAGSRMSGPWNVHSGDGRVSLRLPEGFAADVDAHTGDGHINMNLPLSTTGGSHENSVSGKLNGGGQLLTVHTGDGSIHLDRL
ncbi:MAG: DUF4097 family beta strand repeat-containing protein [Bryobacteraceae bacterium]